LSKGKNQIAVR